MVHEVVHNIDAATALARRRTSWRGFLGRCTAHGLERGSVAVETGSDPPERFPPPSFFLVLARPKEALAPCGVGGERLPPRCLEGEDVWFERERIGELRSGVGVGSC